METNDEKKSTAIDADVVVVLSSLRDVIDSLDALQTMGHDDEHLIDDSEKIQALVSSPGETGSNGE